MGAFLMRNLMVKLWKDDAGVVTVEYIILGTFLALALIVGVNVLAHSINAELIELGNAITTFSQGYSVCGYSACCGFKQGSAATDTPGVVTAPSTVAPTATSIDVTTCP
jgi:Flp pilus assembly pilin Flp